MQSARNKIFLMSLIGMFILIIPNVHAFNSCISQDTINNLTASNQTQELNDLSKICDRQDQIAGNLTQLNFNILTFIATNTALQNSFQNLSAQVYLLNLGVNSTVIGYTQSYLSNFTNNIATQQNITFALTRLAEAINANQNNTEFQQEVNTKLSEFGHNFLTQVEFQTFKSGFSTSTQTQQAASTPASLDLNGIYFIIIVVAIAVVGYLLYKRKPQITRYTREGLQRFSQSRRPDEFEGMSTRGTSEFNQDEMQDAYIKRKKRLADREDRTKTELAALKRYKKEEKEER